MNPLSQDIANVQRDLMVGRIHTSLTTPNRCTTIHIETLELLISQLETRFNQKDFNTVCDMETMLLAAANGSSTTIPESMQLYAKDIDMAKLENQLKLLNQYIKATNEEIKEVTSMRTIANAVSSCQVGRKMLSEVATLLQLYFTIPVTTTTAERSFSALRRLKTWLRSTMS